MARLNFNHPQADWAAMSAQYDADRVDAAEREANEIFAFATRPYKTEFDRRMNFIAPYAYSPRWERERAAARVEYRVAVQPYVDLLPLMMADILADGKMLESTQAAWDAVGFAKLSARAEMFDEVQS